MTGTIALPGLAQSDLLQVPLYGEGGTGVSSKAAQTLLLQAISATDSAFLISCPSNLIKCPLGFSQMVFDLVFFPFFPFACLYLLPKSG